MSISSLVIPVDLTEEAVAKTRSRLSSKLRISIEDSSVETASVWLTSNRLGLVSLSLGSFCMPPSKDPLSTNNTHSWRGSHSKEGVTTAAGFGVITRVGHLVGLVSGVLCPTGVSNLRLEG